MRHLGSLALLLLLLLASQSALAQDAPQEGLFGHFTLGASQATIDPETDDGLPALGPQLGFNLGYRWDSGLALSGGLSASWFTFQTWVLQAPTSQQSALGQESAARVEVDATVSTVQVDLSAWYFLPLGERLRLAVRGGLGYAEGSYGVGLLSSEDDQYGGVAAVSLHWRARRSMDLSAELYWRYLGLQFDNTQGLEDSISVVGLSVGVGWAP